MDRTYELWPDISTAEKGTRFRNACERLSYAGEPTRTLADQALYMAGITYVVPDEVVDQVVEVVLNQREPVRENIGPLQANWKF